MAALALYGAGTSTGMVTCNSLLQTTVPDHNRGRVFAGFDIIWQTGRLASLGLGAAAADALGIQAVYLPGGCCSCSPAPSASPGCAPVKGSAERLSHIKRPSISTASRSPATPTAAAPSSDAHVPESHQCRQRDDDVELDPVVLMGKRFV